MKKQKRSNAKGTKPRHTTPVEKPEYQPVNRSLSLLDALHAMQIATTRITTDVLESGLNYSERNLLARDLDHLHKLVQVARKKTDIPSHVILLYR